MKYCFFEDKQVISPTQMPNAVYEKLMAIGGLNINDDRIKIAFCGVIVWEECAYCFLPAQSSAHDISSLAHLIRVIHSYHASVHSSLVMHDEDDQGEMIDSISLSGVLEIIDLFFNTGILRSRSLAQSEKGRIHWPKTIHRCFPVMSADNIPLYVEPQRHPMMTYQDDVISSIHSEIMLTLLKNFSWLDDRFKFLSAPLLLDKVIPTELSLDQKILLLKQRLHSTFISLEIRTLNLLINYLENQKNDGMNHIVIGVRKFHYVWEFLLKNIFLNVHHKINSALPIPQYHYVDETKSPHNSAEKGMRIDLFIRQGDQCWVIDSKYYSAMTPQSAPGWTDLVKQFFYVKAIRLLYPEIQPYNVKNIFIFPGCIQVLSKIQMTYRQDQHDENKLQELTEDFLPIECLYLDPIDVMNQFINHQKIDIEDIL